MKHEPVRKRRFVGLSCTYLWAGLVLLLCALAPNHARGDGEERAGAPLLRPTLSAQLGHSGPVFSAAFSADGKYVVTSGEDQSVCLWDAASGIELRRLEGHTDWVNSATFSPDGAYVITTSGDKTARLWETATGKHLRTFDGHAEAVVSATFSPNGAYVLTASHDKTACLWKTATGELARRFTGHIRMVYSATFSPDTSQVLTSSWDGTARLWDVASGRQLVRFEGHADRVRSAVFSADGTQVLTASNDTTARLWDAKTGAKLGSFEGHVGALRSAVFSADGRHVLTASDDKTARLWDTQTRKELKSFIGHTDKVSSAAFSPDGTRVLTASEDGAARLWETDSAKEVLRYGGHSRDVFSATFSADSRYILTASKDQSAHLWDLESGRQIWQSKGHTGAVRSATFSPDSAYVLTAGDDKTARAWSIATGKQVQLFEGHTGAVNAATFSADGTEVLTASADKTARRWDLTTGAEIKQPLLGHRGGVNAATYSPDGRQILTASDDRMVRLWDAATGRQVRQFEGHHYDVDTATFSKDGRHIVTASHDKSARVWKRKTGREMQRIRGHEGHVRCAAFSPDGTAILTSSTDGTARLWKATSQPRAPQLWSISGHSCAVYTAEFSPDGRHILTASGDGSTRLWDAATGHAVCAMISFRDGNWVTVAPDGRFDTGDLDAIEGLNWVMPDEPMRALPIEIFMRDYFEPRLLTRVLAGEEFPKLPRLDELNRALPLVRIAAVEPQPGSPACVRVTVQVEEGERSFERKGQPTTEVSGAADLRLFRDGKLVKWLDGAIPLEDGRWTHTFENVVVDAGQATVNLSAHAFNKDHVKSKTVTPTEALPRPGGIPASKPTAFVIGIGVDVFNESAWNLTYAAADAHAFVDRIGAQLAGAYPEVVSVLLTSEQSSGDDKPARPSCARKQDVRAIFRVLAGEDADKVLLAKIPNTAKLRAAHPGDLVLVSISTHGVTGKDGEFYLLPSDMDRKDPAGKWLGSCISADELSHWMRGVDAGQMAMIVDACQSAASVQREGFKPGPMGSKGLGQLAYDKRMRILAASQAEEAALESWRVKHGLLTYALLIDGLENNNADFDPKDGKTTLAEWLRYGVARVPTLAEQVVSGSFRPAGGRGSMAKEDTPSESSSSGAAKAPKRVGQQPSLFDYSRGTASDEPVLKR